MPKRDAVRRLMLQHLGRREIAERLGLSLCAVDVHLTRLRRGGARSDVTLAVRLPQEHEAALRREAEARGLSLSLLAKRLLETIAVDDMVGAVLADTEAFA